MNFFFLVGLSLILIIVAYAYFHFKTYNFFLYNFYMILNFCFSLYLIYLYNEKFLILLTFCLEENFILKNANDWVWCLFIFSLYLFLFLIIPYTFVYLYIQFNSFFFQEEHFLFRVILILLAYNFFFSIFLLLQDFIFSGVISLHQNKKFYFEFQPEIENFIFYLLGISWDLVLSLILYNLVYLSFFIKLKKPIKNILQLSLLFLVYYWFGGEGIVQDCIFITIIYIFLEIMYIFNLIVLHLRKFLK